MDYFLERLAVKLKEFHTRFQGHTRRLALFLSLWCIKQCFKTRKQLDNYADERSKHKYISVGDESLHVLVRLYGGLGDILVAINYWVNWKHNLGCSASIDLLVDSRFVDSVKLFVAGYDEISKVLAKEETNRYDLFVRFCRIAQIEFSDIAKIKKVNDGFLTRWLKAVNDFCLMNPELYRPGTISDCVLEQYSKILGRHRLDEANVGDVVDMNKIDFRIKLKTPAVQLPDFSLDSAYITLQCGSGIMSGRFGTPVRDWPVEKFVEMIECVRARYPKYKFVQVGGGDDPGISNVDFDLRGKTTFEELLYVLRNAAAHVGSESGCVHFRHFVGGGKSVVVFGPTNMEFYGYPENVNVRSDICSGCEWIRNDWREKCLKTGCHAACMEQMPVTTVVEGLTKILNEESL